MQSIRGFVMEVLVLRKFVVFGCQVHLEQDSQRVDGG
jgi:hypothetical protein